MKDGVARKGAPKVPPKAKEMKLPPQLLILNSSA